jgi:hypothetical protein
MNIITTYIGMALSPVGSGVTNPPSPALGQVFYRTDTQVLQYWSGSSWIPISTSANKTLRIFDGNANQNYNVTISTGLPPVTGSEGDIHYQYDSTILGPPPPTVATLSGDVTGNANATVVERIRGIPVDTATPFSGATFQYNSALQIWQIVPSAALSNFLTLANRNLTVLVSRNNPQTFGGTGGAIQFDNVEQDDLGAWNVSQPSRLTFTSSATIRISAFISVVAEGASENPQSLYAAISINGTPIYDPYSSPPAANETGFFMIRPRPGAGFLSNTLAEICETVVFPKINVSSGDYVEVFVSSGTASVRKPPSGPLVQSPCWVQVEVC